MEDRRQLGAVDVVAKPDRGATDTLAAMGSALLRALEGAALDELLPPRPATASLTNLRHSGTFWTMANTERSSGLPISRFIFA